MRLYLDIDGVLLNYDSDTRADYSIELIDYITNEFDCYRIPFRLFSGRHHQETSKNQTDLLGFDIDAGPILFNLSPTGTAFGIGPATYFEDWEARKGMLMTAELAGFTVSNKKAITLAMRTATDWK